MDLSTQSNDVRWLQERNVHIWDLWQIDENGDWRDEKQEKYSNTLILNLPIRLELLMDISLRDLIDGSLIDSLKMM